MGDYTVRFNFDDGVHNYDLPLAQNVSDPIEGDKATIISGVRGNGSVYIPGGKESQTITISGLLFDNDGYVALMTKRAALQTNITTDEATLTCKYWDPDASGGGAYVTDWTYTVRRIGQIKFGDSMRTSTIPYTIDFLVISF